MDAPGADRRYAPAGEQSLAGNGVSQCTIDEVILGVALAALAYPLRAAVAQPGPPPGPPPGGYPPPGAPPPGAQPGGPPAYHHRPPPPPPPREARAPYPGGPYHWHWADGHWRWNGYRWVWAPGHWRR